MRYKVLFPEGKQSAFTLSYDDGQIYDRKLVEMFNRYGLKGTFHLNSGTIGTKNEQDEFLRWEELKELFAGHEVACHGYTHPWFTQLTKSRLVEEILDDKRELEKAIGKPVRGMSYPFGVYSDEICTVAENLGIEYSRTVNDTNDFPVPTDFMRWNPTCHHNADVFKLTERFLNPMPYMDLQLFYVLGHSFEFHRENNWDHMEKFCAAIAGHEEVWYATNIQIKEYLCAAKSLIASVDHDIVYNPSALPIWISVGEEQIQIKPGETIYC